MCGLLVGCSGHCTPPPPACRSPPLVVSQGGGGASLGQPKIFRCGSLCCCVGGSYQEGKSTTQGCCPKHSSGKWRACARVQGEVEQDQGDLKIALRGGGGDMEGVVGDRLPWGGERQGGGVHCTTGLRLRTQFFMSRTALKDSPQGPPTAGCGQPPTPTNHQPPRTNCRQPPPTANRQPPTANRQPPTANRQPPTFEVEKVPWS